MSPKLQRLTVKEALAEIIEPRGKTVIDVGCGDGAMVRHFQRLGAAATGVEVSENQLQRAYAKTPSKENYKVGRGESLPFGDACADIVLYLNSLHHVPVIAMAAALLEASRVLKTGGQLVAIEPLAAGSYFEAMRPIEDETEIRAAAYSALMNPPRTLIPASEMTYESVVRLDDADRFLEAVAAPDPARRERLPLVETELRRCFQVYAQKDSGGFFFIAPMRRNCFFKVDG